MKAHKTFWIGTLVVLAVGLVTGVTVADRVLHTPVHYAEASWAQIFDSPEGLARSVDVIALAQAVDVAPGRVATSDQGEGPLPFQLVEFEVLHGVRGAAAGDRLTVERAGGMDPSGRPVEITADGGEFVPGQAYLLFLQQQADTPYFYQVNNQGRFRIEGDHLHAVAPDDAVATQFHGLTLKQGLARVQAALGERPNAVHRK